MKRFVLASFVLAVATSLMAPAPADASRGCGRHSQWVPGHYAWWHGHRHWIAGHCS